MHSSLISKHPIDLCDELSIEKAVSVIRED